MRTSTMEWEEMLRQHVGERWIPKPSCSGVTMTNEGPVPVGVDSDGVAHHMDFWDPSVIGVATKPIAAGEYLRSGPDGNIRLKQSVVTEDEDPQIEEEDICDEAKRITSIDRQQSYDDPARDFKRIAQMWSALFGREFKPHEVGMAMMCLKLSRMSWDPTKYDNSLDAIGYGRCTWLCIKDEMDNGELYDGR